LGIHAGRAAHGYGLDGNAVIKDGEPRIRAATRPTAARCRPSKSKQGPPWQNPVHGPSVSPADGGHRPVPWGGWPFVDRSRRIAGVAAAAQARGQVGNGDQLVPA
jgi:hypothetical protein